MQRIATFWAIAIGVVWVIIALSTLYTRDYTGMTICTPLMMLATGVVLGIKPSIKRNGKDEENK